MHAELLEVLRCPECGRQFTLDDAHHQDGQVRSGQLRCGSAEHNFVIRDFIPRFVAARNYANSFGMQWNRFRRTQLDSCSGLPISADRFWKATGWAPEQIAGQWMLDAGCGAGRFAEVALGAGARVVALDYSSAADACFANLRQHPNLHVVQGDIYALPFMKEFFPYAYSLGVLQHTPDVARAFAALPAAVADGGQLCVDFYERSWRGALHSKYWLRPITTRMPQQRLLAVLERWVPPLWHLSCRLRRIPLAGRALARMVPVVNYSGILPLTEQQHLEWSLLDTFDWYAPAYDNPQSARTLTQWLRQAGIGEIEVIKAGHLVARGVVAHAPRN